MGEQSNALAMGVQLLSYTARQGQRRKTVRHAKPSPHEAFRIRHAPRRLQSVAQHTRYRICFDMNPAGHTSLPADSLRPTQLTLLARTIREVPRSRSDRRVFVSTFSYL
jgi:hypothetical protein